MYVGLRFKEEFLRYVCGFNKGFKEFLKNVCRFKKGLIKSS